MSKNPLKFVLDQFEKPEPVKIKKKRKSRKKKTTIKKKTTKKGKK